jgi:flavin-dependent dehydrogenase
MTDMLIAGGGLAGAAAAIALAQAGRDVTLLERETAPRHKICGEFISTEARDYLRALGVDPVALGARRLTHLAFTRGGRRLLTPLPFAALSLTRRTLDEALLHRAAGAGARVERGVTVRQIRDERFVTTDRLGTLTPRHLMLATGKHEARGMARAGRPSGLIGFKTYLTLPRPARAALAGHIELFLFPGGYGGLQPVEGELVNLCLLVTTETYARLGTWAALRAHIEATTPALADRLAGATEALARPLTIAQVPYGFVHRGDGPAFRLGDQAAVIHSFTGDGMSIALHSAARAARTHLAGGTAADYHRRLAADVGGQIARAQALHRLVSLPGLAPALFAIARLMPAALQLCATSTRIAPRARLAA